MSGSYVPVRILLGVLCVFFSYWLGRALAARNRGQVANAQVMRWALRVTVTALGACWGGIDWVALTSLGLALLSTGLGYYMVWRPQPPKENLAKQMFPED